MATREISILRSALFNIYKNASELSISVTRSEIIVQLRGERLLHLDGYSDKYEVLDAVREILIRAFHEFHVDGADQGSLTAGIVDCILDQLEKKGVVDMTKAGLQQ
jgi:hypothetical protein